MKRKTRKQTAEHVAKRREALKGKARTEETKKRISEGVKKYWETIPKE